MPSIDPQELETRKLLYEFAKGEFDKQDARWESAEKKATNLMPVLGILLAAAGFFGNWILDEKMLPPQRTMDWLVLSCIVLAFISILSSWVCVLNVLRIRAFNISGLRGDSLIDFFLERDIPTLHTGLAYRFARDASDNRDVVDRKIQWLIRGYYGILVTASLLVLLLLLVGVHSWQTSDQMANWGIFWTLLQGGFLALR